MKHWQKTPAARTPEGRLLIAVIAGAVEDFAKLGRSTDALARRRYRSAERLVGDPFCQELASELGIPLEQLRDRLDPRANAASPSKEQPHANRPEKAEAA